jgi:hypothetical protein
MKEFDFYNVPLRSQKFGWIIGPVRRLLRLLLRPIFLTLERLLESLAERNDRVEAMVCENSSVAHRLSVLEDHVETLLRRTASETEPGSRLQFPESRRKAQ